MSEKQVNLLASPRQEQDSVLAFVIERIKEALLKKELQPGDYLPSEAELARNLGVSKMSVREAIKMLQAMGIVDVKRGRPTRVRENLEEELINPLIFQFIVEKATTQHLIELRLMIDRAFTVMAMEKATEEDIKNIRETIERFERRLEKGQVTIEDDLAFHYAILESTHNPFIIQIGRAILQLFRATIGRIVQENPQVALEDHSRIFTAFCQKDEQAVKDAIMMVKGIEHWKAVLEEEKEGNNTK